MSADNWAVCPKCKRIREGRDEAINKKLQAAYGKVSADEYEARRQRTIEQVAKPLERTFREDFEVGMSDDGTFSVDYRGHCQTCGASFEFKHKNNDAIAQESK